MTCESKTFSVHVSISIIYFYSILFYLLLLLLTVDFLIALLRIRPTPRAGLRAPRCSRRRRAPRAPLRSRRHGNGARWSAPPPWPWERLPAARAAASPRCATSGRSRAYVRCSRVFWIVPNSNSAAQRARGPHLVGGFLRGFNADSRTEVGSPSFLLTMLFLFVPSHYALSVRTDAIAIAKC